MSESSAYRSRLSSLDQFRGYTVAGMLLVNYMGDFIACPFVLKHHDTYCSFADTIMPAFFFAVGFSLRLSFGRRATDEGLGKAYWHVVRRLTGLALVGIFISHQGRPDLHGASFTWENLKELGFWDTLHHSWKHDWFHTLMHITVTSLWILPVIRLRPLWRVLFMVASALFHVGLSHYFYFDWVNGFLNGAVSPPSGVDGGPLGFLTWTIPTMVGTLACDAVTARGSRKRLLARLFGWSVCLMASGWIFSCGTRWYDVSAAPGPEARSFKLARHPVVPSSEQTDEWLANLKRGNWSRVLAEPAFVPPPHSHAPVAEDGHESEGTVDTSHEYRKWNYWMMSQRAGTTSYLTFGAGFSLAVYAVFFLLVDVLAFRIGIFRTLGTNALAAFVLHALVENAFTRFVPPDAPSEVAWISFELFFFICWLFIRGLEKRNIYITL